MVAEERTQVNSSLVTCSLWACGPPTETSTVQSLPLGKSDDPLPHVLVVNGLYVQFLEWSLT